VQAAVDSEVNGSSTTGVLMLRWWRRRSQRSVQLTARERELLARAEAEAGRAPSTTTVQHVPSHMAGPGNMGTALGGKAVDKHFIDGPRTGMEH
jgi:hypothetical protein